MNYCLQGHDRDNGVQEMLISLLPDETHDRVEALWRRLPQHRLGERRLPLRPGGDLPGRPPEPGSDRGPHPGGDRRGGI